MEGRRSTVPAREAVEKLLLNRPEVVGEGEADEIRVRLADAMREARKRKGLRQTDVARRLGVTQGWVSKLESPNFNHQVESLVRYWTALGMTLSLLMHDESGVQIEVGRPQSRVTSWNQTAGRSTGVLGLRCGRPTEG